MATYKVLQDIEAEDTLIGPLTLRQCIYAAIAVVGIYLSVIFVTKHVGYMVIFMLPFIAFGVFFAFPWTKQQSTEVWALAKIRFILKPRRRIWNQSGVRELVTITVPKNLKRVYTNTLSPVEVKSRLKALADTIDSRGWAIKNVDMGYYTKPGILAAASTSDRLLSAASLPPSMPTIDASEADDIFDVQNNPVAQKFDAMMTQSADTHRQQIVQQLAQQSTSPQAAPQPGPVATDLWHMPAAQPVFQSTTAPAQAAYPILPTPIDPTPMYAPGQGMYAGMPQIPQMPAQPPANNPYASPLDMQLRSPALPLQPSAGQAYPLQPLPTAPAQWPNSQNTMTAQSNPAILELANNNDLDIATIAREAQARSPEPPDEVVISLH